MLVNGTSNNRYAPHALLIEVVFYSITLRTTKKSKKNCFTGIYMCIKEKIRPYCIWVLVFFVFYAAGFGCLVSIFTFF